MRQICNTVIHNAELYLVTQMTKHIFLMHIWYSPKIPDVQLPNPWDFLSVEREQASLVELMRCLVDPT